MTRQEWLKKYVHYVNQVDEASRTAGIGPILPDDRSGGFRRQDLAETGIAASRLEETIENDPLWDLVLTDDVLPSENSLGDLRRFSRDEIEPTAGAIDQLRAELRIVDPWPWNIDPDRFAVRERRLRA